MYSSGTKKRGVGFFVGWESGFAIWYLTVKSFCCSVCFHGGIVIR